ncbi:transcriptional regulator [Bacillus sp. HMF5848]|uniref:helix-turn-helix transcriptional regulator n=1 Tax=Bacillus sp. HMF5848 TaxID=2495421 RepID=UPI000F7BA1A2|nr:helix-turn-helix domain-containing protein [Bacillus sp. HMF5848]RSK27833.1 transcriptional regulator [Bacillus sp. HMF5848]
MEQTLKITNVLSDPTRYYIYQYIAKQHNEVTVQEIAESFEIHPNVARLHLSKLEDVNMLVSETKKTGKGGRPSRLYRLSDDVIQLHFPFRDYQLLAKIAIQTMMSLGEAGQKALYLTGKRFGEEMIESQLPPHLNSLDQLSFEQKLNIIREAASMSGFYPEFASSEDHSKIYFQIYNCPFKELASENTETVCRMHFAFLEGMFSVLFPEVVLEEKEKLVDGCASCSYHATVAH